MENMSALQEYLAGLRKQGGRPFSSHVRVHAHFFHLRPKSKSSCSIVTAINADIDSCDALGRLCSNRWVLLPMR